jgi:RNA polymerase sigma factor (sigma-70 family)
MTPIPENRRTTDPMLVNRVRDWHDSEAWSRFVSQYDRHLHAVCARYGLQGDAADECCQQVWIQLAAAMQNFRYDPGRRFRGWLHLFFHSRIKDILKASRSDQSHRQITGDMGFEPSDQYGDDGDPNDEAILAMLRRAADVQEAVRSRVTPDNWEVFRLVGIEGWNVSETATFLGRQYTTVYRSYKRLTQMIEQERHRQSALSEQTCAP